MQEHGQGRGLAAPGVLCLSACPGWGSGICTQSSKPIQNQMSGVSPFCSSCSHPAESPTDSPAEHPAILPCKEQGTVPNSAVLTLSATTTNREAEKGGKKNPTCKNWIKKEQANNLTIFQ